MEFPIKGTQESTSEGVPQTKERIQGVVVELNKAKTMTAGSERDAFIQEQFDGLTRIITPTINRSVDMDGKKIWQFIAEGEGFDLVINVTSSPESISVAAIVD